MAQNGGMAAWRLGLWRASPLAPDIGVKTCFVPDTPPPTNFAQMWGQHMAESPITSLVLHAAENDQIPIAVGDGLTTIFSELAVIHQFLLDLSVAVDNLMESGDSAGT
jgi:hypothetical protein